MRWPAIAPRQRKSKNSAAFWMRMRTAMARLDSWLAPNVMHALGWALIHTLLQGVGAAALAAARMAFSHKPSDRYLIGVGALALMLAMPVTTFLLLIQPAAPTLSVAANTTALALPDSALRHMPVVVHAYPVVAISSVLEQRAIAAIAV